MGVETAVMAGVSAAASIGGAAMSAGGQEKAAQAADEANTENKILTSQLMAAGTPYLMEKGANARADLYTGRQDTYNALVSGLQRTDPMYAEWDSAYDTGRGDLNNALAEWDGKYNQVRSDNASYMALGEQGTAGYSGLLTDPSSIISNPGYQFRLNQGSQALDRSAAAKGKLFSGGAQAAQQQYGQDYASSEYDKELARYGTAIGYGQQAQSRVDTAGMQTASGKSGVYNALAGLAMQRAAGKTGIATGQAAAYQNTGNVLAGLQNNMATNEQQTGQNVTNYWLKAFGKQQEDNSQTAQQQGQAYANQGNAWSQGIGGVGSAVNQGVSSYLSDQRLDKFTNALVGSRNNLSNYGGTPTVGVRL